MSTTRHIFDSFGLLIGLADDEGNMVVEYEYDLFGKPLACRDTSGIGLGSLNPFRFKGYVYDEDSGLYYLTSRYYDPEIGRFLTPDNLEQLDPEKAAGLNLYVYCNNDPVLFFDPEGESEAAKWYKKAADKGSAEALYYLGFMYLEGRGVRKAADKGMDCIWKSANLDYIPAINTYGLMIISGVNANEDDEPNYKEAAEWIKLAANGGDPKNQYAMAWLYENGYGVEQSFEDALEYYELAMNSDIEERKEAEEGYYRMAEKLGRMY